jgi:hypothetical protein
VLAVSGAGAMKDFQIHDKEIQTRRKEIQIRRKEIQIPRNEIQNYFPYFSRTYSKTA